MLWREAMCSRTPHRQANGSTTSGFAVRINEATVAQLSAPQSEADGQVV
jgi:hypothetical protein